MRLDFGAWWLVWYDSVSDRIYHRHYEPNTQAFIRQFLRAGMVAFDVGAHHGFYTLLMARCVGPQGLVVAFEPSPIERRKLVWHLWLNRLPWVRVEPYALADREGIMDFFLTKDNSANSLSPPEISPIVGKVTVPVTTLDTFCERAGIKRVNLIKVDVEGAELLVLKGAQRILTEMRPIIVMEVSKRTTARFGYSVDDLLAFLKQEGYQIRSVPNEENAIAEPIETKNNSDWRLGISDWWNGF
jgi:FkbM family methyltransferase